MTDIDPYAPVIVGVGEVTRRTGDGGPTWPVAMMVEAARGAAADAAAGEALLRHVGAIAAVPTAAWADGDPARSVAEILQRDAVTLRSSMQGGNGPQLLMNALAQRISAGGLDAALLCGAEALSTVARALREDAAPDWPAPDPARRADQVLEEDRAAGTDEETQVGLIAPIMAYPMIENAIRLSSGRSGSEHLAVIAGLWSRFSRVAAEQPAAWSKQMYTPEELATPSAANRKVTLPYTKLLNSNIQVDQAAAVILCSAQTARGLGIPRDRWTFVHAGAQATDEWYLSSRRDLTRSPAIRACAGAVFEHTTLGPDELGPIDLYSCFPAAVELAARELRLPLDDPNRPLTCTGGLTFFGGPGNNYATHGIIAVARALREAPTHTIGLSTALGWYATKHALGLYGNAPPRRPFASISPAPASPPARAVVDPGGFDATAETCTLIYDRDGSPAYGILFALTADGSRALGKTDDPAIMDAITQDGFLGSRVQMAAYRTFSPG